MLGRLPGHEFVLVVESVHDPRVGEHLTRRVADALAEPLTTETIGQTDLTPSVAVAFAGPARDQPTNLLDSGETHLPDASVTQPSHVCSNARMKFSPMMPVMSLLLKPRRRNAGAMLPASSHHEIPIGQVHGGRG